MNLAQMIYDSYPGAKDLDLTKCDLSSISALREAVNNRDMEDTLFTFVVREIHDAEDYRYDKQTLREVVRVMEGAINQLRAVKNAFDNALYKMEEEIYFPMDMVQPE